MPLPDVIWMPRAIPNSLELAFQLRVNAELWNPATSVTKGTTYKDFKLGSGLDKPRLNEGYSSFLLQTIETVESQDADDPRQWLAFNFTAAKTTDQANTAVETWYGLERYHWPRELLALNFYVVDSTWTTPTWDAHSTWSLSGVGASQGETNMVTHKKIRESFSGLTLLKYERFLSPTAWTDTFLASDGAAVPQPAVVAWDLPGSKGEEQDVLHNGIFIPRSYFDILQGNLQNSDFGDPQTGTPPVVTSIPPQTYPATNHAIWTTHTASNEVQAKGWYYERLKVTAYAPPRPTVWS